MMVRDGWARKNYRGDHVKDKNHAPSNHTQVAPELIRAPVVGHWLVRLMAHDGARWLGRAEII
jgi:hypothetical protein